MAKIPAKLDRESLEAWLETRQRKELVAIAHRSAMLVFPLYVKEMRTEWMRNRNLTSLAFFRVVLTSAIGCKFSVLAVPLLANDVIASAAYAADAVNAAAICAYAVDALPDYAAAAAGLAAAAAGADAKSTEYAASAGEVDEDDNVYSTVSTASVWKQITNDLKCLERGDDPLQTPLWSDGPPDWFTAADAKTREIWAADAHPENRTFWIKWWDAAIAGKPLNWDLQRDVALIDDEIWQAGPGAVAKAIREIEAGYLSKEVSGFETQVSPDHLVSTALANLPPGQAKEIARVQTAISEHRTELPATFDALEGYIALEVARLHSINYVSDDHRDGCQSQIRVLLTINSAVCRLRIVVSIPSTGTQEAENIEKLGRVYVNLFQDWPRSNAPDLVDSTCRAALVGVSTVLLTMIGVPATAAVTVGAVIFGGKKLIDGAKAAKDAIGLSKPIAELPSPPPRT